MKVPKSLSQFHPESIDSESFTWALIKSASRGFCLFVCFPHKEIELEKWGCPPRLLLQFQFEYQVIACQHYLP